MTDSRLNDSNELFQLSELPKDGKGIIPGNFSRRTLYHWFKIGKYPEAFSRMGSRLFVDLKRLEDLLKG